MLEKVTGSARLLTILGHKSHLKDLFLLPRYFLIKNKCSPSTLESADGRNIWMSILAKLGFENIVKIRGVEAAAYHWQNKCDFSNIVTTRKLLHYFYNTCRCTKLENQQNQRYLRLNRMLVVQKVFHVFLDEINEDDEQWKHEEESTNVIANVILIKMLNVLINRCRNSDFKQSICSVFVWYLFWEWWNIQRYQTKFCSQNIFQICSCILVSGSQTRMNCWFYSCL